MVMKIAITGHKHGIGKAFAEQLSARGHEIIGISRSDGENIRRITHTANLIEPADLFINNAQSNYAQTELLYEVWNRWALWLPPRHNKWIWNISTQATTIPVDVMGIGAPNEVDMSQYRTQKIALEEASKQLQYKETWPKISIIRPGGVATGDNEKGKSDVNVWVTSVLNIFSEHKNISINELSIGHTDQRIPI